MPEDPDLMASIEADIIADSPIAPTLRKCVLLGGRAGSEQLRDWATQELNGYTDLAEVPPYRRVPAPIYIDYRVGNQWAKGQAISPSVIPSSARELFEAGPVLFKGIASIEAEAADDGGLRLTHARALDVAAAMDRASGNPLQQTTALYWRVSSSSLVNVVEQVKTHLASVIAEMRAQTPVGQAVPSAEVATAAVEKVVFDSARKSRS